MAGSSRTPRSAAAVFMFRMSYDPDCPEPTVDAHKWRLICVDRTSIVQMLEEVAASPSEQRRCEELPLRYVLNVYASFTEPVNFQNAAMLLDCVNKIYSRKVDQLEACVERVCQSTTDASASAAAEDATGTGPGPPAATGAIRKRRTRRAPATAASEDFDLTRQPTRVLQLENISVRVPALDEPISESTAATETAGGAAAATSRTGGNGGSNSTEFWRVHLLQKSIFTASTFGNEAICKQGDDPDFLKNYSVFNDLLDCGDDEWEVYEEGDDAADVDVEASASHNFHRDEGGTSSQNAAVLPSSSQRESLERYSMLPVPELESTRLSVGVLGPAAAATPVSVDCSALNSPPESPAAAQALDANDTTHPPPLTDDPQLLQPSRPASSWQLNTPRNSCDDDEGVAGASAGADHLPFDLSMPDGLREHLIESGALLQVTSPRPADAPATDEAVPPPPPPAPLKLLFNDLGLSIGRLQRPKLFLPRPESIGLASTKRAAGQPPAPSAATSKRTRAPSPQDSVRAQSPFPGFGGPDLRRRRGRSLDDDTASIRCQTPFEGFSGADVWQQPIPAEATTTSQEPGGDGALARSETPVPAPAIALPPLSAGLADESAIPCSLEPRDSGIEISQNCCEVSQLTSAVLPLLAEVVPPPPPSPRDSELCFSDDTDDDDEGDGRDHTELVASGLMTARADMSAKEILISYRTPDFIRARDLRVKQWHEYLREPLRRSQMNNHFDIHAYGTEIIDAVRTKREESQREASGSLAATSLASRASAPWNESGGDSTTAPAAADSTFAEVLALHESGSVANRFLALLQLVNAGNVQICGGNETDGEVVEYGELNIRLISEERTMMDIGEGI